MKYHKIVIQLSFILLEGFAKLFVVFRRYKTYKIRLPENFAMLWRNSPGKDRATEDKMFLFVFQMELLS